MSDNTHHQYIPGAHLSHALKNARTDDLPIETLSITHLTVTDSVFRRRYGNNVVVYDESGEKDGFSHRAAVLISNENTAKMVYWLKGGLAEFSTAYPQFCASKLVNIDTLDEVHWAKTNERLATQDNTGNIEYAKLSPEELAIATEETGSFDSNPVYSLRQLQRHLINAVWYGKKEPFGDIPISILPGLYLGSCQTARRDFIKQYNIKHILRLGWGFPNHCSPQEV